MWETTPSIPRLAQTIQKLWYVELERGRFGTYSSTCPPHSRVCGRVNLQVGGAAEQAQHKRVTTSGIRRRDEMVGLVTEGQHWLRDRGVVNFALTLPSPPAAITARGNWVLDRGEGKGGRGEKNGMRLERCDPRGCFKVIYTSDRGTESSQKYAKKQFLLGLSAVCTCALLSTTWGYVPMPF